MIPWSARVRGIEEPRYAGRDGYLSCIMSDGGGKEEEWNKEEETSNDPNPAE